MTKTKEELQQEVDELQAKLERQRELQEWAKDETIQNLRTEVEQLRAENSAFWTQALEGAPPHITENYVKHLREKIKRLTKVVKAVQADLEYNEDTLPRYSFRHTKNALRDLEKIANG